MRHPVPARLKAYALYRIDLDGDVERHLAGCTYCAQIVRQEQEAVRDAHNPPEGPANLARALRRR